ncbi:uncharacterized protein FPRO_14572 [Fusarium proliferatum ET1]|uniref:Uncharacterized protein n=1 Tax=Fusarium proliferatum (strain ET1) TaxID=1227346 RepID=A0A1L7VWM4_FUSPR|nr:uncharacterized protein FPRO_14572 [Fusarium proliferatum ET1]CZR44820.1 uncharacterized protein FPRO_14572 [Fusarium proliferatum ET1]
MSSFIEIETSPLLAESNTDEAKRVRDEAKATLQQKHPTLVDMAAIDILKVFGAMREARLEIAELCISISFPLVILQCRSLSNLLASLSAFDDQGKVPEMTWHARNLSILGKLENGFGYSWRYQWCIVFERWSNQVKDHHWLGDKTGDLQSNVAHVRPIFLSVKEAFMQIDKMAGTSLVDLLSDVQHAFDMFEHRLAECSAKAEELRVEQERPKHLSPFVNSSSGQSWSSGSNIPSGGITQRTSFGRDGNATAVQVDNSSTKPKERRLTKLRQRFSINPDARENHWTTLFGLSKSPVVLILTAAMPPTIYSTILCGPPDAVPALDSNFYSTLSQFISSLAGLYVIVKPIFSGNKKDKIKTSFPKTFYTMLTLSLLTSLTSAVAYAWSPAASIPLAYVSGLTLNIATLLIIQDSGNQIKETNRYNEDLVFAVNELEMELAENRAERS